MSDGDVTIHLSSDEALVLFAFLSRFTYTDQLRIEDLAEREVLCGLLCLLEKVEKTPFDSDYHDQLRQARDRLRPEPG